MNIENEIFKKVRINFSKLEDYGFVKENNFYQCSKEFMEGFRADIVINEEGFVTGKVYDLSVEEEYTSFRIEHQSGKFVSRVREGYKELLEYIAKNCGDRLYFSSFQANAITSLLMDLYHDAPEFMWEKFPDYGVFKNPNNGKWYGLIANVDRSKLDKDSSGEVEILNVKLDSEKISSLLKRKGFYPAYHMNKKNWITIVLDGTIKNEELLDYIKESRSYTEVSYEWIVPANPRVYDIISHFENSDTIVWKQTADIRVGDIVYLYLGAPYSSILYQCKVVEVSLPYLYSDENLTMKRAMKLKLLKKYNRGQYTFGFLNEHGLKSVRSMRRISSTLSKELNKSSQDNKLVKTDLLTVPNIGPSIKEDLMNIGITCVEDLKGKDPEELYRNDCKVKGFQDDRCLLYVFRMAVYYAENEEREKEKLKWWYWKD